MFKKGFKYKTKHTCRVPGINFIPEHDSETVTLYWYSGIPDVDEAWFKPYVIEELDCDEII